MEKMALCSADVKEVLDIGLRQARELVKELPHFGPEQARRVSRRVLELYSAGVSVERLHELVDGVDEKALVFGLEDKAQASAPSFVSCPVAEAIRGVMPVAPGQVISLESVKTGGKG